MPIPTNQSATPNPTLRWFHPTPARLLVILLAVEAILFLSKPWFPKGYAVLTAIATVGVTMLLMLIWWLAALCFRWRFQFSLRSLLVLTVVVAIPFSWLAVEMKRAREQREAVEWVRKVGGTVQYDYQNKGQPWNCFDYRASPPCPQWLARITGEDCFQSVVFVVLAKTNVTDDDLAIVEHFPNLEGLDLFGTTIGGEGLSHLKGMRNLKGLFLWKTPVDDRGMPYLKNLTNLRSLVLDGTRVTDAGMVYLRGLTNLEDWFSATNTQITDNGLKCFIGFKKLKEMNLLKTRVTTKGVKDLKNHLPKTTIDYTTNGENRLL